MGPPSARLVAEHPTKQSQRVKDMGRYLREWNRTWEKHRGVESEFSEVPLMLK